ncbi:acyl-CoA N-acyltransferase [Obelidium mucronatum]|nr:acyl-CoA N-acyltransferase [Obelidium mucronatum]
MWIPVPLPPSPTKSLPLIAITKWSHSLSPFLLKHLNGENGEAVTRYLRNKIPQPYLDSDANFFIKMCAKEELFTSYAIVTVQQGESEGDWKIKEAIGSIGLTFKDPSDIEAHAAELGYWLAKEYWGLGIMKAALAAFLESYVKPLGVYNERAPQIPLAKVYAYAAVENRGSCLVLERNGFEVEGVLKKYAWKRGRFYDHCLYAKFL